MSESSPHRRNSNPSSVRVSPECIIRSTLTRKSLPPILRHSQTKSEPSIDVVLSTSASSSTPSTESSARVCEGVNMDSSIAGSQLRCSSSRADAAASTISHDHGSTPVPAHRAQPFIIFRLVARFPKSSLLVCVCLLVTLWATTIGLMLTGYDILPINFKDMPINIYGGKWYERALAALYLSHDIRVYTSSDIVSGGTDFRHSSNFLNRLRVDLLYSTNDHNVLTLDRLIRIKEFETEMKGLKDFDRYFVMPFSLMNSVPTDVALDNRAVATMLTLAANNETLAHLIDFVLPKSAVLNKELLFVESKILRSVFFPRSWSSFSSKGFDVFLNSKLRPVLNKYAEPGELQEGLQFSYWGLYVYQTAVSEAGLRDSYWAVGSLLFILVVLLVHTHSPTITGAALFGIVTSLVGANLIYRVVFDRRYIGIFHSASVFVLLGIGADDVFVLYDTWRDSFQVDFPSEAHRLSAVFRRAAGCMLYTSLTSAFAFLVNVTCRIPLVVTFGLLTGLAVIVNYLIVITLLPCVLLNMQSLFEWCATRSGAKKASCCECRPAWLEVDERDSSSDRSPRQSKRAMAVFFRNCIFPIFRHRVVAFTSLVVCLLMSAVFVWQAALLAPNNAIITQLFQKGTNFDRAVNLLRDMDQDPPTKVTIFLGVKVRDRSACHQDSYRCYGKFVKDEGLELNGWAAQRALLSLCRRMRWDLKLGQRLRLRRVKVRTRSGAEVWSNDVECLADNMETDAQWMLNSTANSSHLTATVCPSDGRPIDISLPITQATIERIMRCRPDLFGNVGQRQSLNFERIFDRYYETAVTYWFRQVPPIKGQETKNKFSDYMPMSWVEPVNTHYKSFPYNGRYFGGRARIVSIASRITLTINSDSFFSGMPVRDAWESFVNEEIKKMPAGLRTGFQCTTEQSVQSPIDLWQWYDIQHELWINAKTGILLGLFAVTLPILLLATHGNLLLTGGALLCLGCTTAAVMTIVRAVGWPLGVSESINLALVTGLSVDYIVHFIEAYHLSEEVGREAKVRDMLTRVGGAVTSGAVTTMGSTMFLFGARVLIFIQFGTVLCVSIGFAFFYAIFMLTPLLILFGPEERGSWSLLHLVHRAWRRATGRGSDDVRTCDECRGKGWVRRWSCDEDPRTGVTNVGMEEENDEMRNVGEEVDTNGAIEMTEKGDNDGNQMTKSIAYVERQIIEEEVKKEIPKKDNMKKGEFHEVIPLDDVVSGDIPKSGAVKQNGGFSIMGQFSEPTGSSDV